MTPEERRELFCVCVIGLILVILLFTLALAMKALGAPMPAKPTETFWADMVLLVDGDALSVKNWADNWTVRCR